jgi:hypothetical protein
MLKPAVFCILLTISGCSVIKAMAPLAGALDPDDKGIEATAQVGKYNTTDKDILDLDVKSNSSSSVTASDVGRVDINKSTNIPWWIVAWVSLASSFIFIKPSEIYMKIHEIKRKLQKEKDKDEARLNRRKTDKLYNKYHKKEPTDEVSNGPQDIQ